MLVGVRAAAVNFPDVLMLAGRHQVPTEIPFTPGSEFAGVGLSVGEGVSPLLVGRRVQGATFIGAFAEQVVVPAAAVQQIPAQLDDVSAAAFAVAVILNGSFDGRMRHGSHPCPASTLLTEPPGELHGNLFELAQIALEAGFFDQSHFTRTFKRHFGLTPHAYRRAARH